MSEQRLFPSVDGVMTDYNAGWHFVSATAFIVWVRGERRPRKPVLREAGSRLFYDLAAYTRKRCKCLAHLPRAASDHMDGRYLSEDAGVRDLVAAGILDEVPIEDPKERWPRGQKVTWHLTGYACAVLVAYAPVPLVRVKS